MTRNKRLIKLKQLKRAMSIVTRLTAELKADASRAPETKAPRKREPVDQVADLIINNRVADPTEGGPITFTSNQQAKIL